MSDELTDKQRRFVEEYCRDFNASAAARRAGYSENAASEIGYENLRKPQISSAISEFLGEHAMSAAEAASRMADMARADLRAFTYVDDSGRRRIDLSTAEAEAMLHVIKKIKRTERRLGKGGEIVETKTEVELHDAKDALHKILQAHGVYTERVDVTTAGESLNRPSAKEIAQQLASMSTEEKSRAFKELVGDLDGDTG